MPKSHTKYSAATQSYSITTVEPVCHVFGITQGVGGQGKGMKLGMRLKIPPHSSLCLPSPVSAGPLEGGSPFNITSPRPSKAELGKT